MTWVKIPNTFAEDHRWIDAGADALAIHVSGLCYADRNLTDGVVPKSLAGRICLAVPVERTPAAITALLDSGFWTEDQKNYRIDGYLDNQFSAEEVNENRERWKSDKKRQSLHKIGNHSLCTNPQYCPAIRDGSSYRESMRDSTVDSRGVPTAGSTGGSSRTTQSDSTHLNPTSREGGGGLGKGAYAASAGATADDAPSPTPFHIGPPAGTVIVPVIDWGEDN